MKTLILSVIFALAITSGGAYPARSGDASSDVEFVSPYGSEPVVDTGFFGGNDWKFPSMNFGGMFSGIERMMTRLRNNMNQLFNRPVFNATDDDDFGFPSIHFPQFPRLPEIDLSKGNTTSVTKIIDGHKVVINETTYSDGDDNHSGFFKVRVVNILPDNSAETERTTSESVTTSDHKDNRESMENSKENEIPKNKEGNYIETFDEIDYAPLPREFSTKYGPWSPWVPAQPLIDNRVDSIPPFKLHNDVYVNDIAARRGLPFNPDAEFIDERRNKQTIGELRY